MEYHSDYKIRLETAPEFKNLYPWALQEMDDNGTKVSRDLIQWTLSHHFVAADLTLNESLTIDKVAGGDRTWIRAKLLPESSRRFGRPAYSMMGTKREIESITLFVTATEEDRAARASGFLSYTSSDPLFGGREEDHLQFDITVSHEEFDRLANRIASKQFETVRFTCHAKGIYAEWTPDIDTDEFKVLLSDLGKQEVEIPEDSNLEIPRLGDVWDASFSFNSSVTLTSENEMREEQYDAELDHSVTEERGLVPTLNYERVAQQRLAKEVSSLKIAAWAIFAALILNMLIG